MVQLIAKSYTMEEIRLSIEKQIVQLNIYQTQGRYDAKWNYLLQLYYEKYVF